MSPDPLSLLLPLLAAAGALLLVAEAGRAARRRWRERRAVARRLREIAAVRRRAVEPGPGEESAA